MPPVLKQLVVLMLLVRLSTTSALRSWLKSMHASHAARADADQKNAAARAAAQGDVAAAVATVASRVAER